MKQIGVNQFAEQRDKRNAIRKREILQECVDFFDRHHLPADPLLLHKEGFVNYFHRLYAETYSDNFPAYMTAAERVKMSNVNLDPLNHLWEQYAALRTPFDINTQDVPEGKDYSIYIDGNDEIYYDAVCDLLTAIDNFHARNFEGFHLPQLQPLKMQLQRRKDRFLDVY
jgi:hypothetical protein